MTDRKSPWGAGNEPGGSEPSQEPGAADSNAEPGSQGASSDTPNDDNAKPAKGTGSKAPGGDAPRNPWLPPAGDPRRPPSIEDIFRARAGKGGGKNGGGRGGNGGPTGPLLGGHGPNLRLPQRPDGKSWWPIGIAAVVLLWLGGSSMHRLAPQEQGVVTTFGSYSRTLGPGVSFTLPWPIQSVDTRDVTSIQRETIPEGDGERLMLTGDQNLVNLNYLVRWNIKDLKLYTFQLADPDQTVREVAEASMRAAIAEVNFNDAMGTGRATIEQSVRDKMQRVLDAYRSGVKIQGVEITKIDPPAKVVDAFKEVLAAQQKAQGDVNEAQGWAQKKLAAAQGEAAAFDKVYEQYKLAPEVTKRRMYYETMERVLGQTDKVIVEAPGTVPYLPLPALRQSPPPPDDNRQGGQR
ncbi:MULTISPECIES: protease modulator HflK [unclassified Novosphingobium]|uniref:protease modulator HflK n=1 Tax=unclassified Novosphingobium TaxID=2644732 RepID=UPI001441C4C7|nr:MULTISPECIES: protease modulator HflK [unclassified Novosphingobium]MBB3359924.1 membrane protease subunit HflK [Novosphingobium sp. BK256]MBB3376283.1 membrane protease subunit HflK [Novosphingobium sp. BK280]MBB3380697.1 membrane protease subunit HflK [Novosphingobium sp. BK258]MBB3422307.1 membrane protease subunit HflK [Novosphingobium sp. BK267]MBB3451007.1 membrane protease subunit HflK [Novosphingobium sp. BK352]